MVDRAIGLCDVVVMTETESLNEVGEESAAVTVAVVVLAMTEDTLLVKVCENSAAVIVALVNEGWAAASTTMSGDGLFDEISGCSVNEG